MSTFNEHALERFIIELIIFIMKYKSNSLMKLLYYYQKPVPHVF